jgi:ABC-2 type transport system permease protein
VGGIEWLKYASAFYYYAAPDPLVNGVDLGYLAILAGATAVLVAGAALSIRRRDLRG